MDNYDELSDETYDSPEPAPEAQSSDSLEYWKDRATKAEKQAVERRVALRRHEAAAKHGVQVDKIPDWVPADKLDEFVGQFVASQTAAPDTPETSSEQEPTETEVPDAEKLAGIVNGPSGNASGVTSTVSHTEWLDLVARDSAEAERLFQAGKVDFSNQRQGLGPDS